MRTVTLDDPLLLSCGPTAVTDGADTWQGRASTSQLCYHAGGANRREKMIKTLGHTLAYSPTNGYLP
jgi:hypothetical protein